MRTRISSRRGVPLWAPVAGRHKALPLRATFLVSIQSHFSAGGLSPHPPRRQASCPNRVDQNRPSNVVQIVHGLRSARSSTSEESLHGRVSCDLRSAWRSSGEEPGSTRRFSRKAWVSTCISLWARPNRSTDKHLYFALGAAQPLNRQVLL